MADPRAVPLYQDPFDPVLKTSLSVNPSEEQKFFIREVLDICSSDSKFADKAYAAILLILLAGEAGGGAAPVPPVAPVLTLLSPISALIGGPDFTLNVMGTGFSSTAQIFINGVVAPTVVVSPTLVTTPIDMALVVNPGVAQITVKNGPAESNALPFTITAV